MHNAVSRIMVELAVDKTIAELQKEGSKRAVRNLVELGQRYAKGQCNGMFYRFLQTMLENEASPYYDLIINLARNVNGNMLKGFGINLGFNSWALGTQEIRRREAEDRYNIPWAVVVHMGEDGERIDQLMSEGSEMGIYCYLVVLPDEAEDLTAALALAKRHPDCALVLFAQSDVFREQAVADLVAQGNMMPVVCAENRYDPEFSRAVQLLEAHQSLYGVYVRYSREMLGELKKDNWLRIPVERYCPFLIFVRAADCDGEAARVFHDRVVADRENPDFPIVAIDFYEDMLEIDRIISTEDCYLEVLPDGETLTGFARKPTGYRVGEMPLPQLLRRIMPKVNYL